MCCTGQRVGILIQCKFADIVVLLLHEAQGKAVLHDGCAAERRCLFLHEFQGLSVFEHGGKAYFRCLAADMAQGKAVGLYGGKTEFLILFAQEGQLFRLFPEHGYNIVPMIFFSGHEAWTGAYLRHVFSLLLPTEVFRTGKIFLHFQKPP